MGEIEIGNLLREKGQTLFDQERVVVSFTDDADADALLNDLEQFPHVYVLACMTHTMMKAQKAWLVLPRLGQRLGDLAFATLAGLSEEEMHDAMTNPTPLHVFSAKMGTNFHQAVRWIAERYQGDASRIWADRPPSAAVVCRFLEFSGVGPKIATMTTNILARDFKVPYSDYYSVDISVDTHVHTVFSRLGLVPDKASDQQIVYKARALSPDFPGLLDLPTWDVGQAWCRPKAPLCAACYLNALCPTAGEG